MKINILTVAILSSLSTNAFAQSVNPQTNSDLEVKALITAGCNLTANNINLGILQMPLIAQSAQSNLNVQCSNNAAYEIKIGYGDTISNNQGYSAQVLYRSEGVSELTKIYKDGNPVTTQSYDIQCHAQKVNQVYFSNITVAKLYGYDTANIYYSDTKKICSNNSSTFNQDSLSLFSSPSFGSLIGLSSGEKIAFEIMNPNNKNWSANNYVSTGNGNIQTILVKAQISTSNSPTHRLSPDNYQSNVTIQLSY